MGKVKAKKPTFEQKKLMTAAGYDWKDLLVIEETDEELRLVWRGSGKTLVINKEKAREQGQKEKASGTIKGTGRKNVQTRVSRSGRAGRFTREAKRC